MSKILQNFLDVLLNPSPLESILSIHSLFSSQSTLLPSLSLLPPTLTIPIYQYPTNLLITSAKSLKSHVEAQAVPFNISMMHALAHIEFNAMKAYLDTIIRFFPIVPHELHMDFLQDFLRVSNEEACHFEKLEDYLKKSGFFYGFLPGIDSIREEVIKTNGSLIERVTVLALIQEGKGLDAGPHLLNKLQFFHGKTRFFLIL